MSLNVSAEPGSVGRAPRKSGETASSSPPSPAAKPPKEIGGRDGPEPTRYGDWEKNGRCVDF